MKEEKTIQYNLRLPERLKTKAEKDAKMEKRSLNKHIIHILDTYIQNRSAQEKTIQTT